MTQPVIHHRKIKKVTFTLDGTSFEWQLRNFNIANNTEDGEKLYTLGGGETREEADPDYALELSFFADWRSDGISDFLTTNDGAWVDFVLDHHPDIPEEHVQWTGRVKIKAPPVGGDARATEVTEVTLPIEGKPTYARVGGV